MLRVVLDTNVLVSALMKPGGVPDLLVTRFVRQATFEATAVDGRADFIVTGDGDLLTLGNHERIRIVTPRAFLDQLNRPAGRPGSVHEPAGGAGWAAPGRRRRARKSV